MAIERVREAEHNSTSANDMMACERVSELEKAKKKCDALAIGPIRWYEDIGWYTHTLSHTDSKWFIIVLLLPPHCRLLLYC